MKNIKSASNKIASYGSGRDKILAHINPEEALLLEHIFGGDINRRTGLPQYGGFSRLFGKKRVDEHGNVHRSGLRKVAYNVGHDVEKAVRPIAKVALPIAGTLAGGALGGPLGQILGGAAGGALSSKSHPLDHALGGAAIGIGTAALGPSIGKAFGVDSHGLLGKSLGMSSPSLMSQLGLSSGSSTGGGLGLMSKLGLGKGKMSKSDSEDLEDSEDYGHHGHGSGGDSSKGGLLNKLLLGTMVGGTLLGKSKIPKEEHFMQEVTAPHRVKDSTIFKLKPKKKRWVNNRRAGDSSETGRFVREDYRPEDFARLARGGYVHGDSGGQDDNRKINIPKGSYVWDATTVSLLGDGNSLKGKRDIKKLENSFLSSGIINSRYLDARAPVRGGKKVIRALVSDGEMISPPKVVTKAGNGSNSRGAEVLDKIRKNLRKQKGLKSFLPPKSKSLEFYLG